MSIGFLKLFIFYIFFEHSFTKKEAEAARDHPPHGFSFLFFTNKNQ